MFPVIVSIVLILTMLGIGSNLVMRIRLAKTKASQDKAVWWRRSSDEVGDAYRQLHPGSYLPLLNRLAFWLVVAVAVFALIFALLHKTS
jgi:hypothetical protein